MNTDTERLALRAGPQTVAGLRTSGAPLASRLSVFAKPAAGPLTFVRSRAVADLDLRALRPAIDAPAESPDSGPTESFDEPGARESPRLDQAPRVAARGVPDHSPPITRMSEVSAPTVQRWPATVTREVPPVMVDAPIYASADSPAPPDTRAPPSTEAPPVFEAARPPVPVQVDAPANFTAGHDAPLPQAPPRKEMAVSPVPRTSAVEAIASPAHERPLPAPTPASRNSTPEPAPARDERIAPRRVVRSEQLEQQPAAPAVPAAAKPMGTLHPAPRDQATKSRPPPAASVAALSKLKDMQRTSPGETVRIGTVQVVVRPNAVQAPTPAAPIAPAARVASAPAGSAFRNVWLSRRRYE